MLLRLQRRMWGGTGDGQHQHQVQGSAANHGTGGAGWAQQLGVAQSEGEAAAASQGKTPGCRRMPAQPGQQAHEASSTEPLLFMASKRLATDPNGWVYTSLMGTSRSLCPTVGAGRAYQRRHVPSVHLATGDLQLSLRHRAHLEVFWPSSPCPHDGWQGHRAQLRLAYTVKLLLQDSRPETGRNTRSRDAHSPGTRLSGSAAAKGLAALPPDMLCCKLG